MTTLDKYEYKLRSEEIKDLISQKKYTEAMEIADTIDWRRVKNIMMLTMVSDLYKLNRRYDVSRDMLLLAYDRHPGGRTIVYSLCELSLKLGDFLQAIEYYKEFVRVAPNDNGRYILKYKIYDAQDVSLEERIALLEEFKSVDYREKWSYELAYLYHRAGMESQCVAECDELILTFGEGKYVMKAMELKMLHQPLTPVQQERYDNRGKKKVTGTSSGAYAVNGSAAQEKSAGGYADRETYSRGGETFADSQSASMGDTKVMPGKEMDIQVKTLDVNNKYNTLNIQAALADSMKELMAKDAMEQEHVRKQAEAERYAAEAEAHRQAELRKLEEQEARRQAEERAREEALRLAEEQAREEEERRLAEEQQRIAQQAMSYDSGMKEITLTAEDEPAEKPVLAFDLNMDAASLIENMTERAALTAAGIEYDSMLSMENDGQISLIVPEEAKVEKQITGQMSIEEILSEWEKMKLASEQKSMDDLKQRVLEQTGDMFTEFDKSTKSGLLAGLEDENSSLSHLPIQPKPPAPRPKTDAELLAEALRRDAGLEGEDLPEVEELAEIEELSESEEFLQPEPIDAHTAVDAFAGVNEALAKGAAMATGAALAAGAGVVSAAGAAGEAVAAGAGVVSAAGAAGEAVAAGAEAVSAIGGAGEALTSAAESGASEEKAVQAETEEKTSDSDVGVLSADTIDLSGVVSETAVSDDTGTLLHKDIRSALDKELSLDDEEPTSFDTTDMINVSEKLIEETEREVSGEEVQAPVSRALTEDEKELFGALIQTEQMKQQIAAAIDAVSLAAYTGNVIITGEAGSGTLTLAKNLIKSVQMSDSNFSGKVAKISGAALDKKDIPATLSKLRGGALIVEKANGMSADALKKLTRYLEKESEGVIVILEDTKIEMRKCINKNPAIQEYFNARIDINAMDNDALVAYAKDYAYEQEYGIDDLGVLALYTRISDLQTGDHSVTLAEVRDIIDEAIWSADRKNLKHFVAILSGKRYDDEDMIVLRERDFIC